MKFYKDDGIPLIKIGRVEMYMNAEIRVVRLSDGFVCHRQNKPIKKSEYWDKTKYRVEGWEFDGNEVDITKRFFYVPLKY